MLKADSQEVIFLLKNSCDLSSFPGPQILRQLISHKQDVHRTHVFSTPPCSYTHNLDFVQHLAHCLFFLVCIWEC